MLRFALLQRENDWSTVVLFVLFVVVPLLARVLKWLFTRLGLARTEEEGLETRHERTQRRREEQRRAESEGEELWRRLARGEVSEPPPAVPAPVPLPARVPRETSFEGEEEPEPLSVLGEVQEPSEAPEVSLEREEEPAPLAALATPVALAPVLFEETPQAGRRGSFQLGRGDLRRAILLSEVLGPPVSERPLRA